MAIQSIKRVVVKSTAETSWYVTDERGVQSAASYREFTDAAQEMNPDSWERKENRVLIINTWSR